MANGTENLPSRILKLYMVSTREYTIILRIHYNVDYVFSHFEEHPYLLPKTITVLTQRSFNQMIFTSAPPLIRCEICLKLKYTLSLDF